MSRCAYHRAECICGFPYIELFMVPLPLSSGDIVDDGIPPDVVHGICLTDPKPRLTYDHADLPFIV